MIRRLFTILSLMLIFSPVFSQENQENSSAQKLNKYIDQYLGSIPPLVDSLIPACDHLIAFSEDSVVQAFIARNLFDKFYSYRLMGLEGVAVHIARKYFLSGKFKTADSQEYVKFSLFVALNENSLIGMDAPPLNLPDIKGDTVSLREINSRYVLVYFFDDKCNQCKIEEPQIREILKQFSSLDISVYAVYTQSSKEDFSEYLEAQNHKGINNSKSWFFVWDPQFESGFHLLYNVLSTPQMFLLDEGKKIIGRNLNSSALRDLLLNETARLNNLSPVTAGLVWSFLPLYNLSDTAELKSAFDPLFERSAGEGNIELYQTIFLETFEYLAASRTDSHEDAAVFLAENYIIPKSGLWWDKSVPELHVPKVVARIKRNRIGAVANDFLLTDKKGRVSNISSHRGRNYTILYFYTPECPVCQFFTQELRKLHRPLKRKGAKILGIDAVSDKIEFSSYLKEEKIKWKSFHSDENSRGELYYNFVTDKVPVIYLLDSEWRIISRGIDISSLEKITR